MAKILFAGESWSVTSVHAKGFDTFTTTEYAEGGDAIIAAWVGLELSAERAGFVRSASETPSEFTRRIVSRAAGSAADVDTLLRLYERVRFGDYLANERDRIRAREALRRLREVRQ